MNVISPELALIDPDLAAHARALLPEPGQFRPASHTSPSLPGIRPAQRRTPSPRRFAAARVDPPIPSPSRHIVAAMVCLATTAVGSARVHADETPARVHDSDWRANRASDARSTTGTTRTHLHVAGRAWRRDLQDRDSPRHAIDLSSDHPEPRARTPSRVTPHAWPIHVDGDAAFRESIPQRARSSSRRRDIPSLFDLNETSFLSAPRGRDASHPAGWRTRHGSHGARAGIDRRSSR